MGDTHSGLNCVSVCLCCDFSCTLSVMRQNNHIKTIHVYISVFALKTGNIYLLFSKTLFKKINSP